MCGKLKVASMLMLRERERDVSHRLELKSARSRAFYFCGKLRPLVKLLFVFIKYHQIRHYTLTLKLPHLNWFDFPFIFFHLSPSPMCLQKQFPFTGNHRILSNQQYTQYMVLSIFLSLRVAAGLFHHSPHYQNCLALESQKVCDGCPAVQRKVTSHLREFLAAK